MNLINNQCVICLDETDLKLLKCSCKNCYIHEKCFNEYVKHNENKELLCPMCRSKLEIIKDFWKNGNQIKIIYILMLFLYSGQYYYSMVKSDSICFYNSYFVCYFGILIPYVNTVVGFMVIYQMIMLFTYVYIQIKSDIPSIIIFFFSVITLGNFILLYFSLLYGFSVSIIVQTLTILVSISCRMIYRYKITHQYYV
jgi:hypothetical protein